MKQLQLLDIYIPYSYMTEELMLLPLHIAPPPPPPPPRTNKHLSYTSHCHMKAPVSARPRHIATNRLCTANQKFNHNS